ncbi:MAG TPA: hypothetical protein VGE11_26515 [Pseudonocardia sp.]
MTDSLPDTPTPPPVVRRVGADFALSRRLPRGVDLDLDCDLPD